MLRQIVSVHSGIKEEQREARQGVRQLRAKPLPLLAVTGKAASPVSMGPGCRGPGLEGRGFTDHLNLRELGVPASGSQTKALGSLQWECRKDTWRLPGDQGWHKGSTCTLPDCPSQEHSPCAERSYREEPVASPPTLATADATLEAREKANWPAVPKGMVQSEVSQVQANL